MEGLRRRSAILVFALVIAAALASVLLISSPARAGTFVLWSDGFENGLSTWQISDENPNSGLDYWGVTSYHSSTGGSSVWCAQVGTSSVNGVSNSQNHYYDQNMDANLIRPYGDVSGYSSLSVTFSYWAVTGSFSLTDYLSVWQFAGGTWVQIWTQPGVNSNGWQTASAALSTSSTAVDFIFHSDSTVGLGPYEGLYLDDVSVSGIDNVAPSLSISSPGTGQIITTSTVGVSWAGSDLASGIDHYEFQMDGGTWTGAGTATSYTFNGLADGMRTVAVRAYDHAGNVQTATVSFTVNTNLFSPSGPGGGIALYSVIVIALIVAVFLAFLWMRKRKAKVTPPPPPVQPPD
jgi:hypothetical protein